MAITTLPEALLVPQVLASVSFLDYHHLGLDARPYRVQLTQHVFSFVQAGTKVAHLPGEVISCTPQHALLLPAGPNLMSEQRTTEPLTSGQSGYRSCLLFFAPELLQDFARKYAPQLTAGPAIGASRPSPGVRFDQTPWLQHFVASLHQWQAAGQPGGALLLALKLEEVLLYLLHTCPQQLVALLAAHAAKGPTATCLRTTVEHPAYAQFSAAELAFLLHLSLPTFRRRFRACYGTSLARWQQQQRLQQAAWQLRHTQARASDLYEQAGYASLSSFVQAFRQAFGCPPKVYQQRANLTV